jgi:hypothetical protein
VSATEQKTTRAALLPTADRKTARAFRLSASGKVVGPHSYRRRVVLLNLLATDCGGCVAEIPYCFEFDHSYRSKSLAVVGVSLDIMYEDLKSAREACGLHPVADGDGARCGCSRAPLRSLTPPGTTSSLPSCLRAVSRFNPTDRRRVQILRRGELTWMAQSSSRIERCCK